MRGPEGDGGQGQCGRWGAGDSVGGCPHLGREGGWETLRKLQPISRGGMGCHVRLACGQRDKLGLLGEEEVGRCLFGNGCGASRALLWNFLSPCPASQSTHSARRTTVAAPTCACCPRGSLSTRAPAPRACSFRTTARRARQVRRGAGRGLPGGTGTLLGPPCGSSCRKDPPAPRGHPAGERSLSVRSFPSPTHRFFSFFGCFTIF